MQLEGHIASILGGGLGGILLKVIGINYLILFDAISFVISALFESLVQLPKQSQPINVRRKVKLKEQYSEIITFLVNNKILLYITLFAGIIANAVFMSITLYLPGIFQNVLKLSSAELGIFYSITGIASVLTSLLFLYSKKSINSYKLTLLSLVIEGGVFVLIGLMKSLYVAYLIAIIFGFSCSICSISSGTLNREIVPNNLMGRIGSFNMLISSLTMPLFTALYGFLGTTIDLQKIIFISSIIFFILLIPAPFIFKNERVKDNNIDYV